MTFQYYFYYFYYTFIGFPFVVRVAVTFLTILIPFFLIINLILLKDNARYHSKRKFRRQLNEQYAQTLQMIMTSPKDLQPEEIKTLVDWKEGKLNGTKKRILTNFLLAIKDKQENINRNNFKKLANNFEIQDFWEKKLKYGSAASKCRALRKLGDFNIETSGSLISSLTYNRNPFLRKRARSYYMYFNEHNPFKFLDEDYDRTFNEWDKIEIHRILSKRKEDLPNLTQWIKNSQNNAFKCFLIDEMLHFKQAHNVAYLLKMLKTDDLTLRRKVIYALGEMQYQPAEVNFLEDYHLQPQIIQHAIIRSISKLNTGKSLGFLKENFMDAYDTETKMVLLHAIFNYGAGGKELFYQLKEKSYGFSSVIFNHINNPLIEMI